MVEESLFSEEELQEHRELVKKIQSLIRQDPSHMVYRIQQLRLHSTKISSLYLFESIGVPDSPELVAQYRGGAQFLGELDLLLENIRKERTTEFILMSLCRTEAFRRHFA